jgi:hypothetical protein
MANIVETRKSVFLLNAFAAAFGSFAGVFCNVCKRFAYNTRNPHRNSFGLKAPF